MTLSTEHELPSPHLQRRIREVQAFLAENLDRDVDLRAIAHEASLSPYYFTRQFTAFVGVPPYRYLIQLRIDRAMALLRDDRAHGHADLPPRGLQQPVPLHDHVPPAHGREPVGVPPPPRLGAGRQPLQRHDRAARPAAEQADADLSADGRVHGGSPGSARRDRPRASLHPVRPRALVEAPVESREAQREQVVSGGHPRAARAIAAPRSPPGRAPRTVPQRRSRNRPAPPRRSPAQGALTAPGMWPATGSSGSTSPR